MALVSRGKTSTTRAGGLLFELSAASHWTLPMEVSDGVAGGVLVDVRDGGSWNGTLTFEASLDGTNYVAVLGTNLTTGGTGTTTTISAAQLWRFDLSGGMKFRVRASTYVAGAADVVIMPYIG